MPYIRAEEWRAIRRRLAARRRFLRNPGLIDDSELIYELPRENIGELRDAIAADVLQVKAGAIRNALVEQVVQGHDSRESVWLVDEERKGSGHPFRLTDRVYDVMSVGMFERVLESRWAVYRHEVDRGELVDVARLFSMECVGLGVNSVGRVMSYSGGHVFNIAVCREDDDGERLVILMVEPATRKVVTGFTGRYCLRDILAIVS